MPVGVHYKSGFDACLTAGALCHYDGLCSQLWDSLSIFEKPIFDFRYCLEQSQIQALSKGQFLISHKIWHTLNLVWCRLAQFHAKWERTDMSLQMMALI